MKKSLSIQNALDKINPDILNIKLTPEGVRANHIWSTIEKAEEQAKSISAYFTKAVGFFVPVEVFFYDKDGIEQSFRGGYAARNQYESKTRRASETII